MVKTIIFSMTLLGLISTGAYALQVKSVKDNQTASAKISAKELSRIFVLNERIQSVRGVNGVYELIKDENQGAIYVKPTPYFANKAFNLFITTEQDHTYNLLLMPMDIPAENIEIRSLSPSLQLSNRWEKNSPYVEMLVNFVNSMVNESKIEGFTAINMDSKPITYSKFNMELVTVYKGAQIQGEVWCLTNTTKKTLYIKPSMFFKHDTRAISIESDTIPAGDEVFIYKVINHG